MDKVFNQVTLFQDLCAITNNDKTDKQLCQIAYLIFYCTRAFVDALKKWNEKPSEEKTFTLFKQHMRAEHHALKQVGALTIQESTFQQANMIQQVLSQQSELQDNLQASIDAQVKDSLYNALMEYTSSTETEQPEEINNVAANAHKASNEAIIKLLLKLTEKMENISKPPSQNPNINPKTGKKYKRYCWSCGCCPHWGRDCKHKKTGHQDGATFKNRMGGSNKNCLPVRE